MNVKSSLTFLDVEEACSVERFRACNLGYMYIFDLKQIFSKS